MRGPQPQRTSRARTLRKADNDAERVLWQELKGRQLSGVKFTRQLPIGPYFADFACRDRMLVIELDGSQHVGSHYDRRRDTFMTDEGWSVLRFWNVDALKERQAVVNTILAALAYKLEKTEAYDLRFVPSLEYERQRALIAPTATAEKNT